jgi:mannose-6-phosphate isomerase-like protein (cupin superfamily)
MAGEGHRGQRDVESGPGDAVPIRLREPHGFYNHTSPDLELMIVGITH